MKRLLLLGLSLVLVLTMFLSGCGSKQTPVPAEKPKVMAGFIYVGPIGDGGYTYAHDQGRLYLEKTLGIKTIYKESVPETQQDVETTVKNMIDQGCNVIFATSFGYMDPIKKIATEYPNVKFMHCSGYEKNDTNFGNYFGAMEEARYLTGIVAGMKTKSDKIGYVAAVPIPEVIRGINAFTLGVQSVNKDATVKVVWTSTWYDPVKEKEAAKVLLDKGCDVIAQHQDTTGPQLAAEEAGKFAIGYNTDSSKQVPKAFMTAAVWNWGPYYVDQVKKIMDGTWKPESYYGGLKDGIVDIAPLTKLAPEGAQAKVDAAKAKIKDGSLNVFTGPIYDQAGTLKVADGKTATHDEVLNMKWFVKGVEGSIPAQ